MFRWTRFCPHQFPRTALPSHYRRGMTDPPPTVALLGGGALASALVPLLVAGSVPVILWTRDAKQATWLAEDAQEAAEETGVEARVSIAASAAEAVAAADVVIPAVPWGAPLREVLVELAPALQGRAVLDVSNPFESTALGPKLAMVVPGGSAAALAASALPATTGHVHALTHVRADRLAEGVGDDAPPLPYVDNGGPHVGQAVEVLRAAGFAPLRVGGIDEASLVEAGGPWEPSYGDPWRLEPRAE